MIWLVIAACAVMVLCILRLAYALTTRCIDRYIRSKHMAIERILEVRVPPREWLRSPGHVESSRAHENMAMAEKAGCLKRLEKLINYASNSVFVADEETRAALLDELQSIRTEWQNSSWQQLVC